LYLPTSGDSYSHEAPTIDVDGPKLAEQLRTMPQAPEGQDEEEPRGRRRGRRHRDEGPEEQVIGAFHKEKWAAILSTSSGASSSRGYGRRARGAGNMSSLSMMKMYDETSPQMMVMTMAGDLLPHAVWRSVARPQEGRFKVIEYQMRNVMIESAQMSASNEMPTESISIGFQHIAIRYVTLNVADGKIVEDSKGSWDTEAHKGAREGKMSVPSLKSLCKETISENQELFDSRSLQKLPRTVLDELDIGKRDAENKVPLRGRRLLVTADKLTETGLKFKEIFVKQLNTHALKSAVAEKLGIKVEKIEGVFKISDLFLTEVETNEQVEDLSENEQLFVAV